VPISSKNWKVLITVQEGFGEAFRVIMPGLLLKDLAVNSLGDLI
jgi:hypothetical protein